MIAHSALIANGLGGRSAMEQWLPACDGVRTRYRNAYGATARFWSAAVPRRFRSDGWGPRNRELAFEHRMPARKRRSSAALQNLAAGSRGFAKLEGLKLSDLVLAQLQRSRGDVLREMRDGRRPRDRDHAGRSL